MEISKMKKCPCCGSIRYTESKEGWSCKKCGFTNKKELLIDKIRDSSSN